MASSNRWRIDRMPRSARWASWRRKKRIRWYRSQSELLTGVAVISSRSRLFPKRSRRSAAARVGASGFR